MTVRADDPLPVVAQRWREFLEAAGLAVPPCRLAEIEPVVRVDRDTDLGPLTRIDDLGSLYERLVGWDERRRAGQHYTPPALAAALVAIAAPPGDPGRIADPACGGGAFLLAAARRLAAAGVAVEEILSERLVGVDVDPGALVVAEAALVTWAAELGAHTRVSDHALVEADALLSAPLQLVGRSVDLVVGNPPFQSQLANLTARQGATAAALRARFDLAATGYLDTAALFLLAGLDLVRPAGRVLLLQPHSTLAATSAAQVRQRVEARSAVDVVWLDGERIFDASVHVWAPVLVADARQGAVIRHRGRGAHTVDRIDWPKACAELPSWSPLVAGLADVPSVRISRSADLGTLATATAGFRDEYYGVVANTADGMASPTRAAPAVVTVGMLEPAENLWGHRSSRLGGRSLGRPILDRVALAATDPRIDRWVDARLRPKVLLATQGRVLEAVADPDGVLVPTTPIVSIEPRGDDPDVIWSILAVVLAPATSAWAMERTYGAALSPGAIKLSARQSLQLPLPADRGGWLEGAALVRAAQEADHRDERAALLRQFAQVMARAYGVGVEVTAWWQARLDRRPATT